VSPEYEDELQQLLEEAEQELYRGRALEFSAAADLATLLVAAAPAVKYLVPVIVEFQRRHKDTVVEWHDDGHLKSVKGVPLKEVERLLERTRSQQEVLDQQWGDAEARRRGNEAPPAPPTS